MYIFIYIFGQRYSNFQCTPKIVLVLFTSDMPLKNGRAISNFNLIKEIKRWINCVSHKFSS